jgi:hypothetical protein
MHETQVFIESLVYKKLSPGNGAISIQPFFAIDMYFGAKIKCYVGINIKNGIF